ncbi:MAG: hypothetical protein ABIP55_09865 [Tepidisphaeraceae bacterium]
MNDRTYYIIEQLESRRLMAQYALDLSFGTAGVAPAPASALLEVLPGGKILAADGNGVKRLNADGSIDPTFVDKSTAVSGGRGLFAVIAGDRIILAGGAGNGNQSFFVRAIRLANGDVDTSFGTNGVFNFTAQPVQTNSSDLSSYLTSLVASPDGGVLLGVTQNLVIPRPGQQYGDPDYGDILYKMASNGKFDATFGNQGAQIINNDDNEAIWPRLAVLPSGKFIVLSETTSAIWRYNSNGALDNTFGVAGRVPLLYPEIQFPGYAGPFIQPDGKILLQADSNPDFGGNIWLARLNADGSKDTSFADDGLLIGVGADDIAFDAQGRIIGAGSQLFRLTSGGDPDPTFDDDGFVATTGYNRLDLDAAGRLVVGNGETVARFAPGSPVQLAPDGTLKIDGSNHADTLPATVAGGTVTVTLNGQTNTFSATAVKRAVVNAFDGDDMLDILIDVPVIARGGFGNDSIRTGGGHDSIYAGDGADTVHAAAGNDVVFGEEGGDSVFGDAGNDIIFGGRGNDSVAGGDGNDRLFGGSETPTVPGEGNLEGDSDSLSGNAGNDRIDGMEGNDRVAGNGGRDRLFGGNGNDRVYGGASGDWLYGGIGADQLFGEGGLDRLYADDAEFADFQGNIGVDTLHGNAGDDILVSRDSNLDYLFGDGGDDSANADADDVLTSVKTRTD